MLELGHRLLRRIHAWSVPQLEKQNGRKPGVFGKAVLGILDILMSILKGIRYIQPE